MDRPNGEHADTESSQTATDGAEGTHQSPGDPGWYRDPWADDQRRYWTGEAWTAATFPDSVAEPTPWETVAAPAPPRGAPAVETAERTEDNASTSPAGKRSSDRRLIVAGGAVALLVGFLAAFGFTAGRHHSTVPSANQRPLAPAPNAPTSVPPGSAPPSAPASILSGLVVNRADVSGGVTVRLLPGGTAVDGQPTLDLCNGTFPSEALRTDRLQVAALDAAGDAVLSTEAVTYRDAGAAAQAFAELRTAATSCPNGPVTSPVGEPTVATHFNAAPDGAWPQTATVDRLAFDFDTVDNSGQSQHNVAVYLKRGRVLLGLYFPSPDTTQPAVQDATSVQGIANVFAARLRALPAAAVG